MLTTQPNAFSDHTFLHIDLELQPIVRGKNSWNLASALLEVGVYLEKIWNFWTGWRKRKNSFESLGEWWDSGKDQIKNISESYQRKISKSNHKHEISLEKRLRNAIGGGISDTVNRIKTPHGISADNSEILGTFFNFYQNLYSASPTSGEAQDKVLSLINLKLTQEQSNECSKPFTIADIKTGL